MASGTVPNDSADSFSNVTLTNGTDWPETLWEWPRTIPSYVVTGLFVWSAIMITSHQIHAQMFVFVTYDKFGVVLIDFIVGVFCITGIFMASCHHLAASVTLHLRIFQHLRYTTVKDQQVWIVRILFIIPIYGLCSWLGLWIANGSVYFDAVRGCYEAFVIYNFLRLCMAYVGGEMAILAEINGKPVERSCMAGTCCCVRMSYSVRLLKMCQQMVLQFCVIKPIAAVVTIVLEPLGLYHEGELNLAYGYVYVTFVYNVSVSLAVYGLVMFYNATRHMLAQYNPVLKFFSIKLIVFLSFWQGVLLNIMQWAGVINDTSSYQSFLICIEMLLAAILLRYSFPYSIYRDRKEKGIKMVQIGSHFRDSLNPRDVVSDAIHNFSRVYQDYAQQSKVDEHEVALDDMQVPAKDGSEGASLPGPERVQVSTPEVNSTVGEAPQIRQLINRGLDHMHHMSGPVKSEKVTLLGAESDDDEL